MDKGTIISKIKEARKGNPPTFVSISTDSIEEIGGDQVDIRDLGEKKEVTDWANTQILKTLGIPKSFYKGLGASVQKQVIRNQRALVKDELKAMKARIVADKVTAVLPTDYAELRVEDMIGKLPDWDYRLHMIDPEQPIVMVRGLAAQLKVKGDMCHGFDFTMSEVGGDYLSIEAMLYELACENGNVRQRSTGGSFFKTTMTQLQGPEFMVVAEKLADKLTAETSKLKKALDAADAKMIQDPKAEVESWLETRIPTLVVKKVSARLETDKQVGPMSVGQMAWLVSNVAHEASNYRNRTHFERWAGRLLGIGINVAVN